MAVNLQIASMVMKVKMSNKHSYVVNVNRRGTNTQPWGTPIVTSKQEQTAGKQVKPYPMNAI